MARRASRGTDITLETEAFEQALRRMFERSRRSLEVVVEEQMRGFGREVIRITPPARGSRQGAAARRAGVNAIERDVRKVFVGVHPSRAEVSLGEMTSRLRRFGGRNRRVRNGPRPKIKAARGDITRLVRELGQNVGWLAAGFHSAMRRFNVRGTPWWVSRHGSAPGDGFLVSSRDQIEASIWNGVTFAGGVYGLARRVRAALRIQTRRMNARVDYAIRKAAERSGFQTP